MRATIATYTSYNPKRYSKPWAAIVLNGRMNFDAATLKGNERGGEILIENPIIGQMYAAGQKDYRGNNSANFRVVWDGTRFVYVDRSGDPIDKMPSGVNIDLNTDAQFETPTGIVAENGALTPNEAADYIYASVYAGRDDIRFALEEELHDSMQYAVSRAKKYNRSENGDFNAQVNDAFVEECDGPLAIYIECRPRVARVFACTEIARADCYEPERNVGFARQHAEREGEPFGPEEEAETRSEYDCKNLPYATFKYTLTDGWRGFVDEINPGDLEPLRHEAAERASKRILALLAESETA